MKRKLVLVRIIGAIALVSLIAAVSVAQDRNRHVISAKAGGVNSINGRVTFAGGGRESQLLTPQDDLAAGDVVTTSSGSQAEILLNPGSYLRLGENSVFTLVDNSLDNLSVKLTSGTAIIEATGPDDAKFQISVAMGAERFAIIRSGIYRLNVTPHSSELLVRKGRVLLSDGQLVKGGKKITFTASSSMVARLDKHDIDSFDLWSKQRAETLAQANRKLTNRLLNGYLSTGSLSNLTGSGWGLWTYSRAFGCFTFLPFYYGWSSPYGGYYGNYFNFYYFPGNGLPGGSYSGGPVIVSNPPSTGGSSGGPSTGPTNSGLGSGSSLPASRPPSQAGPRDPDSGSRSINRIRDPRK